MNDLCNAQVDEWCGHVDGRKGKSRERGMPRMLSAVAAESAIVDTVASTIVLAVEQNFYFSVFLGSLVISLMICAGVQVSRRRRYLKYVSLGTSNM